MDDSAPGTTTFRRMAHEFPVRTGLFVIVLPFLAFLQLVNGYVHGGALPYAVGFALLMVTVSVQVTRCHLAAYRRKSLSDALMDGK